MTDIFSMIDTLPVIGMVLALAALAGAFLLVRSVRMPGSFEKNEEKRKKLQRSMMLRDEKNQEKPPEA